jgi:predicted flap endonuclease-1-like 5' DNA nuclease
MSKLTLIEGIGPKYEEVLKAIEVTSIDKLLDAGKTKTGRKKLATASGLSDKLILTCVNHADLMRIKGIGGEYAELLEASGVDTVPELAHRNAANLATKMEEVNEAKSLVRRLPTEEMIAEWVKEAKTLPRVLEY